MFGGTNSFMLNPMNPTGSSPQSLQLVRDVIPDLGQRLGRFTVLHEPADPDLQVFFHEHVASVVTDLEQAFARNDLTAVYRLGHSLKGVGGSVGYPEISALGERVEETARAGQGVEARQLADTLARWLSLVRENAP